MNKLYFLAAVTAAMCSNAQTITGSIVSKSDQQPIAYARIGVENEEIGSIADKDGNYSIDLTGIDRGKNIKVEVGGYDDFRASVAQFARSNRQRIELSDRVREIETVTLDAKKFVERNWGSTTKTRRVVFSAVPERNVAGRSKEMAVRFKTRKKVKLQRINLNIPYFSADQPVFVRFTVYDDDLKPVQTADLQDEISRDKIRNGTYTYDVSDKHIRLKDNFYVGVQLLNSFKGALFISGAVGGNKTIYREYLGEWKKVPVLTPALHIDVKVEK